MTRLPAPRRFPAPILSLVALVVATAGLPVSAQLVINEIHYNPPGADSTVGLEFVEIHNAGGSAVDVSGWELDFGPDPFVFPPASSIAPGSHVVVAESISSLQAATGVTADYEWTPLNTSLSNGGEDVVLRDGPEGASTIVDIVVYDDDPPWPIDRCEGGTNDGTPCADDTSCTGGGICAGPDGNGRSLELINPSLDNTLSTSWLTSAQVNGSPGAQNSVFTNAPTVAAEEPTRLTSVVNLPSVTVTFSASVTGVVAGDLTVDGSAATSVTGTGAGPYEFTGYAAPAPGATTIAIGSALIESGGVPFAGDSWTLSTGLDIVINEIHYHPVSVAGTEEFIELYNAGANTADMSGWTISDGVDLVFPGATTLAPGAYMVLARDAAAFQAVHGFAPDLVWLSSSQLSNAGERLALSDASANELDVVDYGDGGDWAEAADGDGPSLELINPGLPNQFGGAWAASLVDEGTPGAQNGVFQTNVAPIIVDTIHDPPIPAGNQSVTILALVLDETATTVTLYHRQDQAPTVAYQSVAMVDDGTQGDFAAGDRVFGAIVPGLAAGERMDFAIVADDGTQTSVSPSGHDTLVTGENPTQTHLIKFSDDPLPTDFPSYHVITTQNTRNLQEVHDKTEYDATFVRCDIGGTCEIHYNVIERYRGATSLQLHPHSLRVEFPGDRPLDSELGFPIRRLNLMGQQPARQMLGYEMFEALGIPAPSRQLVHVITDPEMHGGDGVLHVNVERIDDEFFTSQDGQITPPRYPDRCDVSETVCETNLDCPGGETCIRTDNGKAYRGRMDGDLRWEGPGPPAPHPGPYGLNANGEFGYEQETRAAENDWTDLIPLADALTCSSSDQGVICTEDDYDGTYASTLPDHLDVDQWTEWFAFHMLANNKEGGLYLDTGDDFYVYFWPTKDHATLLPWDMDALFGANWTDTVWRTTVPSVQRFLRHDAFAGKFVGSICDQMNGVFSQAAMDARIDALPDSLFPTGIPQGNGPQTKDAMKLWVGNRLISVMEQLTTATTLTGVPASPYISADPVISLSGDLNQCGAREVLVNGVPADYTIANPSGVGATWSYDFTLTPGPNMILVQTVDHDGVEIDRAEGFVLYAPPSPSEDDGLRLTMPTRMINSKTLTLKAEIVDSLGRIDWETWSATGTVAARRVSDGSPVDTSITVFDIKPERIPASDSIKFYNGVGSVSILLDNGIAEPAGDIEVIVTVGELTASRIVTVLDENQPGLFRELSGTLLGPDLTWSKSDGVIRITGNATVQIGDTLTIEPGTLIMVDTTGTLNNGTVITVSGGNVSAVGTADDPIHFFSTEGQAAMVLTEGPTIGCCASNPNSWTGINHTGNGTANYTNVFVTGAGNGPLAVHPRPPIMRFAGAYSFTMTEGVIVDSPGMALSGPGFGTYTVTRSLVSRCGIGAEFNGNGNNLLIEDSWFTGCGWADDPVDGDTLHVDGSASIQTIRNTFVVDGGDDGIDQSFSNFVVENTIIYDHRDKALSLTGGSVTMSNSLVFNAQKGVVGTGSLDFVTIATVGPISNPITVERSVLWPGSVNTCLGTFNNTIVGNPADLGCGTGNLSVDPQYADPGTCDYNPLPGSPALTAGPTGGRIGWLGYPETSACFVDADCDDLVTCTLDQCVNGACDYPPIDGCVPCTTDPDCDDGNTCTQDTCSSGACTYTPQNEGLTCDDGLGCTISDTCASGVCAGMDDCPVGEDCSVVTGVCEPEVPVELLPIFEGENWRFFRGVFEPPSDWNTVLFDDSAWEAGPSGFGYDDGDDNTLLDASNPPAMQNNYSSVYIRRLFDIPDPGVVTSLMLEVDYDDGYVCYVNGSEVARSANMSGTPPAHSATASSSHEASSGTPNPNPPVTTEIFPVLSAGTNVVACQGHNSTLDSSDFSLIVELSAVIVCQTATDCDDGVACTDDTCDGQSQCSNTDNCGATATCNVLTGACDPLPQTGDVIISGFQANGVPEWIELFNTTGLPISLTDVNLTVRLDNLPVDGVLDVDWDLAQDEGPGLAGLSIPANGFFLIGEPGTTPAPDLQVNIDLATGELGENERAASIQLTVDGTHMDYVLYGRHDGSDSAAVPPGDRPFDGVTFPRTEVVRSVAGAPPEDFLEGAVQRVSAQDLYAGFDVEGFYTDEATLPGTFPPGVWTSAHDSAGGNAPRNSASPPVLPDLCQVDQDCDDGNACTVDTCDTGTGVCTNDAAAADGFTCDDGDLCTQTDTCNAGTCEGSNPVSCDDINECTVDSCDPGTGQCTNDAAAADGFTCDDGDLCTQTDTCSAGTCEGSNPVSCDDINECTVDSCDPGTGQCTNDAAAADGFTCDDGDLCTQTDTCNAGACEGSNPVSCDDTNECTVDSCDPGTGQCTNDAAAADGFTCDDGDLCTQTDTCSAGTCEGSNPVSCDDINECTVDSCDPGTGQCTNDAAAADGFTCDDGDLCTQTDTCNAGTCEGSNPVSCDDTNECTVDSCDPGTGQCTNDSAAADGMLCDDGSACTELDLCSNGACQGTDPPDCDDGDVCTVDSCDPVLGCQTEALPDGDSDGVCDLIDNCPDDPNTLQADFDTDGEGDACDCDPLNPANPVPDEIGNTLVMSRAATDATLTWSPAVGPYSVYRGYVTPGEPFAYTHSCIAQSIPDITATDVDVPFVRRVYYYLVSQENACGESILHLDAAGTPVPTDGPCGAGSVDPDGDGIEQALDNCPQVDNALQEDGDADGRGDACDNCPADFNPAQRDDDDDGTGNACDPDYQPPDGN